uniref:CS domain-containing protein n=3 Tax=Caenorhabditis tropicalis TaxID=1561998 RepID=A0A1I7UV50_9PELO
MVKFMEFLNREDLTSTQIRSKSEEYRANFMSALNDSESVSAAYKDEQEMRKRGKEEEKRVEVLEVRIGRVTTQHFDKLAPDFNIHVEHPYKDTKISVTEPFELETIQELLYKKWDKVETKVQVKGHIYVFVVTISPWEEETFKVILKFKSKVLNVKVMLGDVVDDGTIWDWVHETEKAETVEKEVQTEKEVKKEEGGDQLANRLEEQSVAGPSTSQVVQPARPLVAGPRVAGSSGPSDAGPSTSQCPEAEPPVENPKADGKKNKRNSSSFFGRKCDQFRNLLK